MILMNGYCVLFLFLSVFAQSLNFESWATNFPQISKQECLQKSSIWIKKKKMHFFWDKLLAWLSTEYIYQGDIWNTHIIIPQTQIYINKI